MVWTTFVVSQLQTFVSQSSNSSPREPPQDGTLLLKQAREGTYSWEVMQEQSLGQGKLEPRDDRAERGL